jgi:uncharacterized membrane protein
MFLFIAAVVIVLIVRWQGGKGGGTGSARAVLDERYARDEIDREDYLARKRDLG